MSKVIDQYISQNNVTGALEQCLREQQYHLGLLIARIYQTSKYIHKFHRLYAQLEDATNGILTDDKEIQFAEHNVNESNPPFIDPETDEEDSSSETDEEVNSSETSTLTDSVKVKTTVVPVSNISNISNISNK